MYYDGCPILKDDGDFLTYEEFMLPKQTSAERDLPEPDRDVLDKEFQLD